MTPKHESEVEVLKRKFNRKKMHNHLLQCASCRAKVSQAKALHKARVAQLMGAQTTTVESPEGGLTVVAFKKKPHLDATPHMPSATGNDKVH